MHITSCGWSAPMPNWWVLAPKRQLKLQLRRQPRPNDLSSCAKHPVTIACLPLALTLGMHCCSVNGASDGQAARVCRLLPNFAGNVSITILSHFRQMKDAWPSCSRSSLAEIAQQRGILPKFAYVIRSHLTTGRVTASGSCECGSLSLCRVPSPCLIKPNKLG